MTTKPNILLSSIDVERLEQLINSLPPDSLPGIQALEEYCVYYDKDNCRLNYSLVIKMFFSGFVVISVVESIFGLFFAPVYVVVRWLWPKVWK